MAVFRECLAAGVATCRPGQTYLNIGRTITSHAKEKPRFNLTN